MSKEEIWGCILFGFGVALLLYAGIEIGNRLHTDRYLITGERNGDKVERVVDLHSAYRREPNAPIIKETDGYDKTYHHIYYSKAQYDDTIYGFDTICEIVRLKK